MSIVLPLLGLLSRANPHLQLIALVIPHLRNPKIRYDIGFSVGAFTKINVCFVTPFWVAVMGKAKLKILALVSPYSEKAKVRHVSDFNLGSFR